MNPGPPLVIAPVVILLRAGDGVGDAVDLVRSAFEEAAQRQDDHQGGHAKGDDDRGQDQRLGHRVGVGRRVDHAGLADDGGGADAQPAQCWMAPLMPQGM